MNIINGEQAPDFSTIDVYNEKISLSDFKGKKVLITFFRSVGCPVCNLRFHELQKEAAYFKSKNLIFIGIYESKNENMLKYVNMLYPSKKDVYPIIIGNPERDLYQLYNIERSFGKVLNGMVFHGMLSDFNNGKKLYTEKIMDDSPKTLINADFLIDEQGKVINAHYGKYAGHFIPISDVKKFINS